jgi:hypothetical protein
MGQLAADAFLPGNMWTPIVTTISATATTTGMSRGWCSTAESWFIIGASGATRCGLKAIQLKVGGIGAVVTHPDYRKQNLMHQAAQDSFEAMRQMGYDLSILRGRHYVKMGYARAWNYVTYRFKLEDFPVTEPVPTYQPLGLEHVPAMDAFYNQTHASFTGTAIRPTFYNKHPEDLCIYAWRAAAGNLLGYVRAAPSEEEPKTLLCLEAAGDPRQCLAVLGDLFKQGEYEKIACFTLPHQHPLLQHLRQGNCTAENRYFDITGWRVRIINLHSTLVKLVPLFEKRLANSQFAGWTGNLRLEAGDQCAVLQIAGGNVAVADEMPTPNVLRGGADVARFLIGSDEPDEIIRQARMDCSGLARSLVKVLFPNLYPMLSHWDEF